MAALTAAVLALVTLAIAPGLLFYFDITPKVVALLLGAAVALPWLARRSLGRFEALVALFWLGLLVSTLLSPAPEFSIHGSTWRRLGLVTWTAVLAIACVCAQLDPAGRNQVLRAVSLSGGAAALYGIGQFFGWDPWLPPAAYHIGEGEWTIVRPPGPLGYVSYFATCLLGAVFAGVALYRLEAGRLWRTAGACAAGLAIAAIFLSGTRGAIAGLAAGGLVVLARRRPRLSWRAAAAFAAILAVAVLFYLSPAGQRLRSRTRWYVEDPFGGSRLWLWRDTLMLARDHWLSGIGPESFSREFPRYQSVDLAQRYPDFYYESPHNILLDVLAGQGVFGLAIFGMLVWTAARGRRSPALLAWLAAALVAQQFASFTAPTALYLFVCLGLLAESRPRPLRLPAIPSVAVAALVSAALAIFAVRLLAADRHLALARSHLASHRAPRAIACYATARRWGMSADIWYARRLAAVRNQPVWQEAMLAAARAVETADDPHNAWYNLAVFFGMQNDRAGAERALRRAIEKSPNWYKPHWMLAQLLQTTSRLPEAAIEAQRAAILNAGKTPEVSRTNDQIRALLTGRP
jgi:O-antigen ligase